MNPLTSPSALAKDIFGVTFLACLEEGLLMLLPAVVKTVSFAFELRCRGYCFVSLFSALKRGSCSEGLSSHNCLLSYHWVRMSGRVSLSTVGASGYRLWSALSPVVFSTVDAALLYLYFTVTRDVVISLSHGAPGRDSGKVFYCTFKKFKVHQIIIYSRSFICIGLVGSKIALLKKEANFIFGAQKRFIFCQLFLLPSNFMCTLCDIRKNDIIFSRILFNQLSVHYQKRGRVNILFCIPLGIYFFPNFPCPSFVFDAPLCFWISNLCFSYLFGANSQVEMLRARYIVG